MRGLLPWRELLSRCGAIVPGHASARFSPRNLVSNVVKRTKHLAGTFARLRRMANNLLQQERIFKCGVKTRRLKAALEQNYMLKLLQP
jgi:hypothetical protein